MGRRVGNVSNRGFVVVSEEFQGSFCGRCLWCSLFYFLVLGGGERLSFFVCAFSRRRGKFLCVWTGSRGLNYGA